MHHYRRFMEQTRDFDQRLGTVLNLAFQHANNLMSTFKVYLFTTAPKEVHYCNHAIKELVVLL